MKTKLLLILFLILNFTNLFAQTRSGEIEKLIENERNFARRAAETSIRRAFLDYLADDGLMFVPEKVNGKTYWNALPENKSSLAWYLSKMK